MDILSLGQEDEDVANMFFWSELWPWLQVLFIHGGNLDRQESVATV